ncbi:MAG: hypothetical protein ACRBB0_16055 [Pelagimonas sp.]|uniref:hypothetical protein n=1 Tax=Pelagimonas sp. TaxID=2073170 RepID=UPI003D6C298F
MRCLIAALILGLITAHSATAQERVLRWQNLDPTTTEALLQKLETAGFELQDMRPLSLIVTQQACSAGCTVRAAGCACPKTDAPCPQGQSESPGGALCSGPLSGVQIMLEDGRVSAPVALP